MYISGHGSSNQGPDMTRTFTFDEAQLHVPGEPGKTPMALWCFYSGKAEIDGRGDITAIWIDRERTTISPWPVPLGHELFRMLATSLRITHADEIRDLVDDIWTDRRPAPTHAVYVG